MRGREARVVALLERLLTARRSCRWVASLVCLRPGCSRAPCLDPPGRHLPRCSYGAWVGSSGTARGGVGAPCSATCAEVRALLAELAAQPGLL